MKFDLTKPCDNCPFRTDINFGLDPGRAAEIAAVLMSDGHFTCHKTNDYSEDGETRETEKSQHCAGALIFLEAQQRPNQIMRIAERLGMYDRRKLDMKQPVAKSTRQFILQQEQAQPSLKRRKRRASLEFDRE